MSALQRTRTGRQVCRCLEEETECDQYLSRALIASCFRRECSCLCGGSEMNLPILFRTRTGRPTSRDRPCQSRDFVVLFGHVISFGNLENKNFLAYSINVYFFMFIIMLGYIILTVCIGIKPLDNIFSKFEFIIFLLKYIFSINVLKYCKL